MEYVSPIDERVRPERQLAARPASITGRRIVLLDIAKARGDEFLDRLEQLLEAAGAATSRTRKPTFSRPAPSEVIEQVAIHGDLAIVALAD